MASFTPVVKGASSVLIHAPGLVRYGSKPWREIQARPSRLAELQKRVQSHSAAEAYLPNQVFLGQASLSSLYEVERPWYGRLSPDRKSTRLNSSHSQISYAVFSLQKNPCSHRLVHLITPPHLHPPKLLDVST